MKKKDEPRWMQKLRELEWMVAKGGCKRGKDSKGSELLPLVFAR